VAAPLTTATPNRQRDHSSPECRNDETNPHFVSLLKGAKANLVCSKNMSPAGGVDRLSINLLAAVTSSRSSWPASLEGPATLHGFAALPVTDDRTSPPVVTDQVCGQRQDPDDVGAYRHPHRQHRLRRVELGAVVEEVGRGIQTCPGGKVRSNNSSSGVAMRARSSGSGTDAISRSADALHR
ncbi:hypothetical protein, partial [Mycobacterium sp. E2497]|uniref:hypothetical protein n=1 Tax=Mycobacterium sp. E2497 TaxID=1834135 RepID=UPI001E60D3DA